MPSTTPARRFAVAALVIAPLVLAAFYMWALWNPVDTLHRLPIAIVNVDAGAVVDGDELRAGDDVTKALVDGADVEWHVVDLDEAKDGVENGDYYFSVVIPETFSADIASAASGDGHKARLEVVFNDFNSLVVTPVGEGVMDAVRSAVSESISAGSVDQVLLGLTDVGKGMSEAAAGARQLADGTGEVLDGTVQLSDGSIELSAGLGEAHTGSITLAVGSSQLSAGASEASKGGTELSVGLGELAAGTAELGAGAAQISEVISMVTGPIIDAANTQNALAAQLDGLAATLEASGDPTGRTVAVALRGYRASLATPPAGDDLVGQLTQLRDGAQTIAFELSDPSADYRGGMDEAAAGSRELSDGLGQLATGASELDAGAHELSAGLAQLDAGGGQLRDGLGELRTGVTQLDDGSGQLATGLADGAGQIPQFTEDERTATADILSSPVAVDARNINPAAGFGPGVVPVLLSVLLFVFGLLTWFVLRPAPVTRRSDDSDVRHGLRRYRVPGIVLGVEVVALTVLALGVAKSRPDNVVTFLLVMVLIGATALALGMALTTVFGAVNGTFIGLGVLMLQVFSFGAVYPIEQMALPFRFLHDLMPLTYAMTAMRSAVSGNYGGGFWLSLIVLAGFFAISVAIATWWRGRTEDPGPRTPIQQHVADIPIAAVY